MPKWLIYALLSVVLWGLWAVVSKIWATRCPPIRARRYLLWVFYLSWDICAFQKSPSPVVPVKSVGATYAFVAGLLVGVGNLVFYQMMSQGGKASTVTPLTSMYPLVTVLLAVPLLGERMNAIQTVGVLLALFAIYLFNVGREADFISAWRLCADPHRSVGDWRLIQKVCRILSPANDLHFGSSPVSSPLRW